MYRKLVYIISSFVFISSIMGISTVNAQMGVDESSDYDYNLSADNPNLEDDDYKITKTGTLFINADDSTVEDNIANDLVFTGGNLILNGNVEDNVIIFGNAVEINGDVNGDIIFAGGTLILNGNIDGDVKAMAALVYINSPVITGDVTATGYNVSVLIDTTIQGEIDFNAWNTNEAARTNPRTITEVEGGQLFNGDSWNSIFAGLLAGFTVFSIVWGILMLIGTIILGYVILRIFPVFTAKTLKTMKNDPLPSIGAGCLAVVIGFFLMIILAVSLIGLKLLFFLFSLMIVGWMLGSIYAKYSVGRMLLVRFNSEDPGRMLPLLVGIFIVDVPLGVMGVIPPLSPISGIIGFFLVMWGLGAIVLNKYRALYHKPAKEK